MIPAEQNKVWHLVQREHLRGLVPHRDFPNISEGSKELFNVRSEIEHH
jgi:hypothetical protein